MSDAWHAECFPCGWLELHDSEDDAIKAAEIHVQHFHAGDSGEKRGESKMGVVQLRTVGAAPEVSLATPAPAPFIDWKTEAPVKPEGEAVFGLPVKETITTPTGEVIELMEGGSWRYVKPD